MAVTLLLGRGHCYSTAALHFCNTPAIVSPACHCPPAADLSVRWPAAGGRLGPGKWHSWGQESGIVGAR